MASAFFGGSKSASFASSLKKVQSFRSPEAKKESSFLEKSLQTADERAAHAARVKVVKDHIRAMDRVGLAYEWLLDGEAVGFDVGLGTYEHGDAYTYFAVTRSKVEVVRRGDELIRVDGDLLCYATPAKLVDLRRTLAESPRPCRLTFIMGDDRDESDDDPSSLGDESVAYGEDVDDFDPSSPPPNRAPSPEPEEPAAPVVAPEPVVAAPRAATAVARPPEPAKPPPAAKPSPPPAPVARPAPVAKAPESPRPPPVARPAPVAKAPLPPPPPPPPLARPPSVARPPPAAEPASPRSPAEKAALYATTESFEERRWARTLEVVSVEERRAASRSRSPFLDPTDE